MTDWLAGDWELPRVTRFAPSLLPGSSLHEGSLYNALANWWEARRSRGRFFLRFDYGMRTEYFRRWQDEIKHTLSRCGLDWDGCWSYADHAEELREALEAEMRQRPERFFVCRCSQEELQQRLAERSGRMPYHMDRWEKYPAGDGTNWYHASLSVWWKGEVRAEPFTTGGPQGADPECFPEGEEGGWRYGVYRLRAAESGSVQPEPPALRLFSPRGSAPGLLKRVVFRWWVGNETNFTEQCFDPPLEVPPAGMIFRLPPPQVSARAPYHYDLHCLQAHGTWDGEDSWRKHVLRVAPPSPQEPEFPPSPLQRYWPTVLWDQSTVNLAFWGVYADRSLGVTDIHRGDDLRPFSRLEEPVRDLLGFRPEIHYHKLAADSLWRKYSKSGGAPELSGLNDEELQRVVRRVRREFGYLGDHPPCSVHSRLYVVR